MAEKTAITEFQFVNSTIDTPTVPQDLAIRALIRKQAMKKASAARRRDGNYGKHNLRQYPVFLLDQNNTIDGEVVPKVLGQGKDVQFDPQKPARANGQNGHKDTRKNIKGEKDLERNNTARWLAKYTSVPASLPARGYELTSIKSEFDILDLSNLATTHINRAGRAALSQNPSHLIHQLRSSKQHSYLSFLPSLYGQIPCLSDATDCVIARARQIISPNRNWEAAVISFYVKALDSLQKALDCPKQRYKPEVLCATEILAMYELLDPSGETAWIRHAAGASRLIQLRGPKNYATDFEQALLMAHTGPIMTEALLQNERCFLEQPAWKNVLRSVAHPSAPLLGDRSPIVVSLMVLKCNIPGLCVDVTNIICHQPDPDPSFIIEIACKIHALRVDLLKWHDQYTALLSTSPPILPGTAEFDRKCKVFATYLSCMIISSRLLGAISPTERSELEEETMVLTGQMLDLEVEVKNASLQTYLFMAQTLGVSHATINTSDLWRDASDKADSEPGNGQPDTPESPGARGLIEVWKFEKWNRLMARKIS